MQGDFAAETVPRSLDTAVQRALQHARVASSTANDNGDDETTRLAAVLTGLPTCDPDFESIPTVRSIRRLVAAEVQSRPHDATPAAWDALRTECLAIVQSTHDATADAAAPGIAATEQSGTSCNVLCFDNNIQVLAALDASLPDNDTMYGADAVASHEWGRLHDESISHVAQDGLQRVERYLTRYLRPEPCGSGGVASSSRAAGSLSEEDDSDFVDAVDEVLRRQTSELLARVDDGGAASSPWAQLSSALLRVCTHPGKATDKASEVVQHLFDLLPICAKRALLQQALALCAASEAALPALCLRLVHRLPEDWHALRDEEVQVVLYDALNTLVLPHVALCSRLDATAQWLQTSWARRATLTYNVRCVFLRTPRLLAALRDGLPTSHAVALLTCILPCLLPVQNERKDCSSAADATALQACAHDALDALITCVRETTVDWPWSLQRDAVRTIRTTCAALLADDERVRQCEATLRCLRDTASMTQEGLERNVMLLVALLVVPVERPATHDESGGHSAMDQSQLCLTELDRAVGTRAGWLLRCAETRRGACVLRGLWRKALPHCVVSLPHTLEYLLHTVCAASSAPALVTMDDLVTLSRSRTGWQRVRVWLAQSEAAERAVDYAALLRVLLSSRGLEMDDDDDDVEGGGTSVMTDAAAAAAAPQTQLTCDTVALLMRWCSCAPAGAGLMRAATQALPRGHDVPHAEWLLHVPVEAFATTGGAVMCDDGPLERTAAAARGVRAAALLQRVRLLLWLLRLPSCDVDLSKELRVVLDQVAWLTAMSQREEGTGAETDTVGDTGAPFADASLLALLQCAVLRVCLTQHTRQAVPCMTSEQSDMLRALCSSRRGLDPVVLLASWLVAVHAGDNASTSSAMPSWLPAVLLDGFAADVAESDMAGCAASLLAVPPRTTVAAAARAAVHGASSTRARQLVTHLWPHLCRADADLLCGCVVAPLLSCTACEAHAQGEATALRLLRRRSETEWLAWLDTASRASAICARVQAECSDTPEIAAVLRQGGVDLCYVVTLCLTCWLRDARPPPLGRDADVADARPTDCTLRRSLLLFAHEGLVRWERCVAHSLVHLVTSVHAALGAAAAASATLADASCCTPHCTRALPLPSALFVALLTTPFTLQCAAHTAPITSS